jgi:spermidine/putrescine transport system ATP-binding protein
MSRALLSIRHLRKSYGGSQALHDLSLDVAGGEFVALLGPSGCGKTTLLRCIGGFIAPDSGSLLIDGVDLVAQPAYRRPINTVFQNYALFPHLNVLDNVAYGPRRHGIALAQAREEARHSLSLVGLDGLADRLPRQLSGGQQQRAALARAVVNRPKLLLLDEPLSALDPKLRKRMQLELKELQHSLGIAFIFVTHDQEEALTMADRIAVMNNGRIEQVGSGETLYRAPATRFVADFIGESNLIECDRQPDGSLRPRVGTLALQGSAFDQNKRHVAVLRPEQVELVGDSTPPGLSTAVCCVEDCIRTGSHTWLRARVGNDILTMLRFGFETFPFQRGDNVTLGFRLEHLHVIAE